MTMLMTGHAMSAKVNAKIVAAALVHTAARTRQESL